jgi:hypothetical protein
MFSLFGAFRIEIVASGMKREDSGTQGGDLFSVVVRIEMFRLLRGSWYILYVDHILPRCNKCATWKESVRMTEKIPLRAMGDGLGGS